VSGLDDTAGQFALGLYEFPKHEEGGVNIVLCEQVEQARCPGGIGPVVVGESQLAGTAWGNESPAEELRPRPARGIGESADAETGCSGDTKRPVNARG